MAVKKYKREFESQLDIPGGIIKQARKLGKNDDLDMSFALAFVLERRQGTFTLEDNEHEIEAFSRYMDTYGLRRVQEVVPQDIEDEGK